MAGSGSVSAHCWVALAGHTPPAGRTWEPLWRCEDTRCARPLARGLASPLGGAPRHPGVGAAPLRLSHALHVWTRGLPPRVCPSRPLGPLLGAVTAAAGRGAGACVGPAASSSPSGRVCTQVCQGSPAPPRLRAPRARLSPESQQPSVTTPAGDTGGSWVRCTVVVTGTGERAQTTGPDSSQREPALGPPAPRALTAPPGGQRTPHPPHSAPRGVWGVPGQLRSVPAHSCPLRLSPLCPTLWWLSALCDRNHRQCRSQKEPLLPCQGSRSGQSRATLVAAKGLAPPGFPLPRRPRPAPGACWSRRTPSGDLPGGRRRAGRARASQEKHSFSRRHCTVTSQRCRRHTLSARHAGNLGDSVSL